MVGLIAVFFIFCIKSQQDFGCWGVHKANWNQPLNQFSEWYMNSVMF